MELTNTAGINSVTIENSEMTLLGGGDLSPLSMILNSCQLNVVDGSSVTPFSLASIGPQEDAIVIVGNSSTLDAGNNIAVSNGSTLTADGGTISTSLLFLNDQATLEVEDDGTLHSDTVTIGTINSNCNAILKDSNTAWHNSGSLTIASTTGANNSNGSSVGELRLITGSQVNTQNCTLAHDQLNVNNNNLTGTIELNGIGSKLNVTNSLIIGRDGHGVLDLTAGATTCCNQLEIALNAGSTGNVAINNSALTAQDVSVGVDGVGTFSIDDSTFNINNCYVGNGTGDGTLTVNGFSNFIVVGLFEVGTQNGHGELIINQNADVSPTFDITIGTSGTLRMDGGDLMVAPNQTATIDGNVVVTGATSNITGDVEFTSSSSLAIANGAALFVDDLHNDGDEMAVDGMLTVQGDYTGTTSFIDVGAVAFQGKLSPGNELQQTVSLSYQGNFLTSNNTVLCIDIGGTTPGSGYDQLSVFGFGSNLNAQLQVNALDNGFVFQAGQQFEIVTVNGTFPPNAGFAGLPEGATVGTFDGLDLNISYVGGSGNDIVLTAVDPVTTLYGDINLDGNINLLDVAPFVTLLSINQFQEEADVNIDGNVNLLDVAPFVTLLSGN